MPKTIDLKKYFETYGEKVIKARCRAEGFRNSDFATVTINNTPIIEYDENILTVKNVLIGIDSYDLYIDGVLKKNYSHDSTLKDDITIDLTEFALDQNTTYAFRVDVHVGSDVFSSNECQSAKILGVSGLYAAETALRRTDMAVGLTYAIDSSTGQISSDFDNEFPYKEMQRVEIEGNVFVKIPAMYFRIGTDANQNITDIAVAKFPIGDGDWYGTKEFYYGAYGGYVNSSKLYSKTGVTRTGNTTRGNFRTYAKANGAGYQQLDIYHKTIMNFLWLIEFAEKDSAKIMTGRYSGNTSICGGTDTLTSASGFNTSTKQMRYRFIEDFIGGMLEFYDGVYSNYYTSNPNNYSEDSTGKNQLSYTPSTAGKCIASLGWDNNNPFICMPKEEVNNGNYNTYFCDYGTSPTSSYPICYGGVSAWAGSVKGDGGVFCLSNSNAGNYSYTLGARLLKCPE